MYHQAQRIHRKQLGGGAQRLLGMLQTLMSLSLLLVLESLRNADDTPPPSGRLLCLQVGGAQALVGGRRVCSQLYPLTRMGAGR